jgi:hypothetical protein
MAAELTMKPPTSTTLLWLRLFLGLASSSLVCQCCLLDSCSAADSPVLRLSHLLLVRDEFDEIPLGGFVRVIIPIRFALVFQPF